MKIAVNIKYIHLNNLKTKRHYNGNIYRISFISNSSLASI
jgi:hypothetical protein